MIDDSRQAGALSDCETVEVTQAMLDAGVAELREKMFGESLTEIVRDVFYAMRAATECSFPPQR